MSLDRPRDLARLQQEHFDLLVIGGGATGAGVALDAANRGLKVALIERDDFASGTSSRSTKLVHGGVRYLEAAITQFDYRQFRLVREALAERATLLRIAPHLVHPLRTVVPAYSWWDMLVYRVGLWLYDRAAGDAALGRSRPLSSEEMLQSFPRLRRRSLKGGVAYCDGQFDDARMALALLSTAAAEGAAVVNHVEATALRKQDGKLCGAEVHDALGGQGFSVHARVIVNATGPGCDAVRKLEDPQATPLLQTSRGTHLALDAGWAPGEDGLLIPKTADGRVLFVLPWQDRAIAGTTDVATPPTPSPEPDDAEVDYLIRQLGEWFNPTPEREDVRARWAGLRPLIAAGATGTARIVREHHIEDGPAGLVTIAGGKWTTYRLMAEEALDHIVETHDVPDTTPCRTQQLPLHGSHGFHPQLAAELAARHDLDPDIADHLAHAYGGQATKLLAEADPQGRQRLTPAWPFIEAEVLWAKRHEMAHTADDFLARRTRLAFLDEAAARAARPRIEALLA